MQKNNVLLEVKRLPEHIQHHYEIKDPSVVALADGTYMMFASVGNSITQTWLVGRFTASNLLGPWQEVAPVTFHNLEGPQLCAPAVLYSQENGQPVWTMYIQTACFEENGVIALATSTDGQNFYGQPQPQATRDMVSNPPAPVIGVYDVGVSEIKQNNEQVLCMLYSGYRRVGCGDLYLSTKKKSETQWSPGHCLVSQEEIPFHNHPDYEHFEWGLEGAKLIQLANDSFLLIGVCFLPLPTEYLGTRQRVFLAASTTITGPYTAIGMPFVPQANEWKTGENGHPDTIISGNDLIVIYQERSGDGKPWHLRAAVFDLMALQTFVANTLHTNHQPNAQRTLSQPRAAFASLNETEQYHLTFS